MVKIKTSTQPLATNSSQNKWLMRILMLTIVVTAWTAITEDVANNDGDKNDIANNNLDNTKNIGNIKNTKQALMSTNIKRQAQLAVDTRQQIATEVLPSQMLSTETLQNNTDRFIPWQKLKRQRNLAGINDLFIVHSWLVVPPIKKVKPPPLPMPVAPPAPFTYIGQLDNTPSGTQIFLMANNRLYTVVTGEKIDQQWRLDADDANLLHLTYLPLGMKQTLSKLASANLTPEIAPAVQAIDVSQ